MKRTFSSADYFEGRTIFNIGGNNFRLIASVDI
jgi:mRNA-degrading endonuclease HigB of HigAB toxin-antitoxin module